MVERIRYIFRITNYNYIISHSAGSTILLYTLSKFNITDKHIVSFDGHILHKKIHTTPRKAIKATLNNMKPCNLKTKIVSFTQSSRIDNILFQKWLDFISTLYKLKLRSVNCTWLSIRSTIVNNKVMYTPYTTSKNNDRFCKSLLKYMKNITICMLLNGCHYDVSLYSNYFSSLIYSFFYKKHLIKTKPPKYFIKNRETGFTKNINTNGAYFFIHKLNAKLGEAKAKFFVPYRTASWSHPWKIKTKITSGNGLEINPVTKVLKLIDHSKSLIIDENEPHFFISGSKSLNLHVTAYIGDHVKSYKLYPVSFIK